MVKRFFMVLAVCVLLIPNFVAYADVIFEPENDFYIQNSRDCVYLGRSFTANGNDGSVPVKNEPGKEKATGTIKNGETVYVEYSCLYDGDYWGLVRWEGSYGWVKMEQMLVLYDYISFDEEHFEEFYQYTGNYDEIKKESAACTWAWPGSEGPLWTITDLNTDNFWVSYAYMDQDGREWGFVTYLYGSRNIWVCLSDPLNRDMPVFNPAPEPDVWESETMHVDIRENTPENEFPILVVVIILVITLVVGTAVLIRVIWKPSNSSTEEGNDE